MSLTDKEFKPLASKKWLYGSLAVVALALGLFLNNDAIAIANDSALNTVEQVDIDKDDDISIEDESDIDSGYDYEYEDSYTDDYLMDED